MSYWSVTHQRLSLGFVFRAMKNTSVFFLLFAFLSLVGDFFFKDPTMIIEDTEKTPI